MRTTLTLDEDVAAKLKLRSRKTGRSFKEVVNEALRLGLGRDREKRRVKPFRVRARDLGLRPGFDLENVWRVIEQLDGPAWR